MRPNLRSRDVNPQVQIKVVTWNKDSHGLFDYQSKTLSQKKFNYDVPFRVFRDSTNSQVQVRTLEELKKDKTVQTSHTLLAEIIKKESPNVENRFLVRANMPKVLPLSTTAMEIEGQSNSQNIYLIVRSLKNRDGQQKGYQMEIGDVVKLGRIEYHVCEMKLSGQTMSLRKNFADLDINKVYNVEEGLQGTCKICLVDLETEDNFFIAPCNCKGSCNVVHIGCLKRWIESKIVVKQHALAISYNFTKFECQICKIPYPTIIMKQTKNYELFVIERPNNPYVMLQALQTESKGNKTLYMISAGPSNEVIKLGRGHQCQIRITDISVSREHAHIKYQNERFVIIDNSSKFGTLIKLQKDLPIKYEKMAVQIGRTVVTCALKNDQKDKSSKNIHVASNNALKK